MSHGKRIFISYSRADRQFVDEIVPLLRRMYGHDSVWFDDDIHGGVDYWAMILDEVARCDLFIYLASNASLESPYCQAEFREALRLQKQFLPVIVRPKTEYPGDVAPDLEPHLRQTQFVDLSRGFGDTKALTLLFASVSRLLDAVPPQQPPPLDPQPVRQPPEPDKPAGRRLALTISSIIGIATILLMVTIRLWIFVDNGDNKDVVLTSTDRASATAATPKPSPSFKAPTTPPAPSKDTPELPVSNYTPARTVTEATEIEQTLANGISLALTDDKRTVVRANFWTQPEGSIVEVVKGTNDEQKTPHIQHRIQIGHRDGGPAG